MIKLLYILGVAFIIFTIVAVYLLFMMNSSKQQERYHKVVEKNISVLKSNEVPHNKSRAFTKLIKCSYVLIHVLINNGNKYNDEKQTRHFCSSLSPEYIDKIGALEVGYEKRTTRI